MFCGSIRAVGWIEAVRRLNGDYQLTVRGADLDGAEVEPGCSIAVNGASLTADQRIDGGFVADVPSEILAGSTLGDWNSGDPVNLEPAMTLGGPLHGHLVSGHVDGVGHVLEIEPGERFQRLTFSVPDALLRYLTRNGFVAVDGVSLKIDDVKGAQFLVSIPAHLHKATIVAGYRTGTAVNIEVDLIARYLERLLSVAYATARP